MDDIRRRFDGLIDGAFEISRQRESRWLALTDEHIAFAADDDAKFSLTDARARELYRDLIGARKG